MNIALKVVSAKDTVRIIVADNGPGIPVEDRERVLKRFVRLDGSRSLPGSGLGLSLVAGVARLHEGEFKLEDGKVGFQASLTLPALLQSR